MNGYACVLSELAAVNNQFGIFCINSAHRSVVNFRRLNFKGAVFDCDGVGGVAYDCVLDDDVVGTCNKDSFPIAATGDAHGRF